MTIKGTTIRRTTVAPIPAEAGLRAAANGCSRRRFIRITAAAAAAALLPGGTSLRAATVAYDADRQLRIWQGVALGADAMLQIHHPDAAAADELIDRCLTEVARLERVFSLYREDSALSHLNRTGGIDGPPLELVELMGEAEGFSRLTAGAFDATVQPLWDLYADHFSKPDADPLAPGRPPSRRPSNASGTMRSNSIRAGSPHQARHGGDPQRHRPGIHHRPYRRAAARCSASRML